jgi:preprotein translocase subunit YajC
MNSRESNESDIELEELIAELDQLQLQVNTVSRRLQSVRERQRQKTRNNSDHTRQKKKKREPLRAGDRVVVTNRYKGRQGLEGTIVKVTAAQVQVKPDNGDEEFRIYKANVRRIK